jgi:hypothetical protein
MFGERIISLNAVQMLTYWLVQTHRQELHAYLHATDTKKLQNNLPFMQI